MKSLPRAMCLHSQMPPSVISANPVSSPLTMWLATLSALVSLCQALRHGGSRFWADLWNNAGGRRIHWSPVISQKVHHPLPVVQRASLQTGIFPSSLKKSSMSDCLSSGQIPRPIYQRDIESSHRAAIPRSTLKALDTSVINICVLFLSPQNNWPQNSHF